MSIQLNFLRSVAFAAMMAGTAMADTAPDAKTVIATVNGAEITLGQMILVRTSLPEQYAQLPNDVLFDGILEQLIQQAVLAQSFSGDIPARVAIALQNEQRSLLAAEAVEQKLQDAMTEEALRAAYEAKYEGFEGAVEYDASHILVETQEEAAAIRQEIMSGADFANMAREKSTGPSGPSGGALGWFGAGMMVPPFEDAVRELEVGKVSEPVETQFGWHLIMLNDSRKQAVPLLDDVREELVGEVQKATVDALILSLTEDAAIARDPVEGVTPDMLQRFDLLGN